MRRFSRFPAVSSIRKPCGSAASRLTAWRRAHKPSSIVTACASSVVNVAAGLLAPSTNPAVRRVVVMIWESTRSDPAAVDDVALARARRAVVGGEEEHDSRDVFWEELALQALAPEQLLLALGSQPEFDLALGHDPSGYDRVDADVHRPEIASQRAGQSGDGGLGAQIRGHPALADHPRRGAEVDDRAAAGGGHLGRHRLRREELVAQVHREA